tara:strand:+ start:154 stop:354 length:201 start_codon:yes stop_codon:yes gene_type:complete
MALTKVFITRIIEVVLKRLHKDFNFKNMREDIEILKSDSHPPIFSNNDYSNILERLKKLEKERDNV